MRIFKHHQFAKWAKKIKLSDASLKQAIAEIQTGLVDANLGHGILKKRVALNGRGKRGGVRTIIAFQAEKRAIYIYGFAKNARGNITAHEVLELKQLANIYLSWTEPQIAKAISIGELIEVVS